MEKGMEKGMEKAAKGMEAKANGTKSRAPALPLIYTRPREYAIRQQNTAPPQGQPA